MAKTEILLESGTNEIEIMVFTIYGELYGINVAKVKEVMKADTVKPMPHAHPAAEVVPCLLPVVELLQVDIAGAGERLLDHLRQQDGILCQHDIAVSAVSVTERFDFV